MSTWGTTAGAGAGVAGRWTDVIGEIWHRSTTSAPPPPAAVVGVTALVALVVVCSRPLWLVGRHVVTIAHESGHAVMALATGRRLSGIRLHADTSGLTVSYGKPRGPGMVATAFGGYIAPALLGLGAAALLRAGYAVGLLWVLIVLLALLLVQIRNWFGLLLVLLSAAVLVAVSWWSDAHTQSAVAYLVTWFLLFGAVRPVFELQTERRRGRAANSDADILAKLTAMPAVAWVGIFALVTVGALALGGWWIIEPLQGR